MTFAEILADIRRQLDWRGPTGKPQGHVVLGREAAEVLESQLRKQITMIRAQGEEIFRLKDIKGTER